SVGGRGCEESAFQMNVWCKTGGADGPVREQAVSQTPVSRQPCVTVQNADGAVRVPAAPHTPRTNLAHRLHGLARRALVTAE
ncbi:MAG: hypothetical protein PHT98_04485, partial [Kiritimatiellae bacterium]|nr:hypothetical protein [Kiritimatiellia bacterium]